jgi:RNA-binding protein NOB1
MAIAQPSKPVHTLILDAGPIIKGEPPISTLLQQCEQIVTIPSVVSEIRDQATRSRLETTVLPFLHLRTPTTESIKFVSDFARKTGDLAVLSKTDIQLLALAYDVECERNGGDWRLRKNPGQMRTNGPPPSRDTEDGSATVKTSTERAVTDNSAPIGEHLIETAQVQSDEMAESITPTQPKTSAEDSLSQEALRQEIEGIHLKDADEVQLGDPDEDSDSEGWITPSNIKRKQIEENNADSSNSTETKIMQAVSNNIIH